MAASPNGHAPSQGQQRDYYDAPEVYTESGLIPVENSRIDHGLQAVHPESEQNSPAYSYAKTAEGHSPYSAQGHTPYYGQDRSLYSPGYSGKIVDAGPEKKQRKWLPWVIGIGIAVIVIVGIVVGCVVGLVVNKKGAPASQSNDGVSVCHNTVCPQILSTAVQGSNIHVFARGADKNIWARGGDGFTWSEEWKNLGGGPFTSQPTAEAWNWARDDTIHVFAVAEGKDRSVLASALKKGSWSGWENLMGSSLSPSALCTVPKSGNGGQFERIDAWNIDATSGGVEHNYMDTKTNDFRSTSNNLVGWDNLISGLTSNSTPGVLCRDSDQYHDVFVYGKNTGSLRTQSYSASSNSWSTISDLGGKYVADPVLLEVNKDNYHFFGIRDDGSMDHISYSTSGKFSAIEPLRGSFVSVPSAVAIGDSFISVFALGKDDKIKHRYRSGTTWSNDWEDLGLFANSAPKAAYMLDANVLALMAIGRDGDLSFSSWQVPKTPGNIGGLAKFASAGGNLTTAYLKVG